MRVDPLRVARLAALALFVKAPHRLGVAGIDARLRGQPLHVIPVALLGVAMLQRAQARVGLDDTAVDAQLAPAQKPVLAQRPQQHAVDRLELFERKPLADDREAAVIRRRLLQPVAEESARTQAVVAPRGDRPLAGQVLEEADHEHLEIHHRIDARPSAARSSA